MISDKDFKVSLKRLVKSEAIDDLILVLKYNYEMKNDSMIKEPNRDNLLTWQIELRTYLALAADMEFYKKNPERI